MVPPEEVKQPVRQEHRDLGNHGNIALGRLFPGGLDTDNHVPKRGPGKLGEVAFLHCEREHIRWAIDVAINLV